jgi:hypothetical protein
MHLCVDIHCLHVRSHLACLVIQLLSDQLFLIIVVIVYHPNTEIYSRFLIP